MQSAAGPISTHTPATVTSSQPPSPIVEISVGASPAQSPADSPDTLASDTVIVSSPEPGHQEDIMDMDIETLQDRQYMALETVQELTLKLARPQSYAWCIAKRIKTMRENPGGTLRLAETGNDMEMERID